MTSTLDPGSDQRDATADVGRPPAGAANPQAWGFGPLWDAIDDAVIVANAATGRIMLWNAGAAELFHYSASEAIGLCIEDLVPPALKDRHRHGLAAFAQSGRGALVDMDTAVEVPALRRDGVEILIQLNLSRLDNPADPAGVYVMGILHDVTKLRESEQTAKLVLNAAAQPVFALDLDGNCTLANRAAARALGHEPEHLRGRNIHDVIHHSRPDGSPYPVAACPQMEAGRGGGSVHVDDEVFWRADGTAFAVEYQAEPIVQDGTVLGAVVTFVDITQRRRSEAEALVRELRLRHRAETDPLTGIGNRRYADAVLGSLHPGDAVAVIDIDHFKAVNDALGHAAGDKILISLATHLQQQVRSGDSVARYGGDEFLVVLRGATGEPGAVVERMSDLWAAEERVTVSAGIAIHKEGRSGADTLKHADAAMYEAKRKGRDRVIRLPADGAASPPLSIGS